MGELGDEYTESEARINRIFDRLTSRVIGAIMTSADETANKIADTFVKAKAEIDAVLAELRSQSVSQATLDRLENLSREFDDLNPDTPVEPPAEPPA